MSLPEGLATSLQATLGERIVAGSSVSGGSINDAWRVERESGAAMFVKSRAGATAADFQAEAAGLAWLAEVDEVRAPRVVGVGSEPAWLALEWVEPGALSARGAEELGYALAALHRSGADAPGRLPPGSPDAVLRIGSVELDLGPGESWPAVYAEMVLELAVRARAGGALSAKGSAAIEAACAGMDELAGPAEPPARLHGDLWGGNVLAGSDGRAWLIDPAAYGGHREVDLAMLRLFGAPDERTFAAYEEAFPLAAGHEERVALWQVLPLLVHAVLFGGSYGAAAARAAAPR